MIRISNFKLQHGKQISNWEQGFTLVELLVVIAIIGILSTLLTANFIGVRQRGRDSQRKSNLRQIQSALELYRADQAGYPSTFPVCGNSFTSPNGQTTYMTKVPCDPNGGSYTYSSSDITRYTLIACLENQNDSEKDATNTAPCSGTTNFSYTLRNP